MDESLQRATLIAVQPRQARKFEYGLDVLVELGGRVRELFCSGIESADRLRTRADDEFMRRFASAVVGGRVGIVPRLFLRKLVDVLGVIELHPDFDSYSDYDVKIANEPPSTPGDHR